METKEKIKIKFSTLVIIIIIIAIILVIGGILLYKKVKSNNLSEKNLENENTIIEETTASEIPTTTETSSVNSSNSTTNTTASSSPTTTNSNTTTTTPKPVTENTNSNITKKFDLSYEGITIKLSLNSKKQVEVEVSSLNGGPNDNNTESLVYGMKRKLNQPEVINGFSGDVAEIEFGTFGQDESGTIPLFLMKDGSIEYITLKDLLRTNNPTSNGKLPKLKNIVKMESVDVTPPDDSGYMTMYGYDNAGTKYDIGEIILEQNISNF